MGTINGPQGYQGTLVSVEEKKATVLPTEYSLRQNYPNPFNPLTTINYELPENSHVLLTVYNLNGQEVARLVDSDKSAGIHSVKFDATNLSTGIYIYKLSAKRYSKALKMLLLK